MCLPKAARPSIEQGCSWLHTPKLVLDQPLAPPALPPAPGTAVPALTVPAVDVPTVALQLGAVCFGPRDTRPVPAAAGSVRKMLLQGFGLFGLFFFVCFSFPEAKGQPKARQEQCQLCDVFHSPGGCVGRGGLRQELPVEAAQHHRPARSSAPRHTARPEPQRGTRVVMQGPGLACPAQHLWVLAPLWGQKGHRQGTELSPGERNPLACGTTKRSSAHRSAALQQPLLTASVNDIHPISRCEPRVARRISK